MVFNVIKLIVLDMSVYKNEKPQMDFVTTVWEREYCERECVYVCDRERDCVFVFERERRERKCVCVCVCAPLITPTVIVF